MKTIIKELSVCELFGMTLAFIVTAAFTIFLCVLTYHIAKLSNLI